MIRRVRRKKSHRIALAFLQEGRGRLRDEIAAKKRELEELEASIREWTDPVSSSGSTDTGDYANIGLTAAALKYVNETPGKHTAARVKHAIVELGFTSTSKAFHNQVITTLKRLVDRELIALTENEDGITAYTRNESPVDVQSPTGLSG